MSIFLLSFATDRFLGSQKVLDGVISNHRLIESWASPFTGCYLIVSDANAPDIRASLDEVFDRKGFIIAKIEQGNSNTDGRAKAPIWDWLREADTTPFEDS